MNKLPLIGLKYNDFLKRKPLVLNIELSHACNLKCKYCGRIMDNMKGMVPIKKATAAIDNVKAPINYFTGGEPFLFPDELNQLVEHALSKKKFVIIVTNGTVHNFEKLKPDKNLAIMFSVDGLEKSHDAIRGKGSFSKMRKGMLKAKEHGHNVWLNFTLFKGNIHELEDVVEQFDDIADHFHFNMFYDFLGNANEIKQINDVADRAIALKKKNKKVFNPFLYFDIWKGIELDCTPWGTVTLDPKGWRSPCYFAECTHFDSYDELMKETQWKAWEKKKMAQCKNCKAHCGFEPTIYRKKELLLKEIWTRIKNKFN